jgi:lysine 2,3-aminomutase
VAGLGRLADAGIPLGCQTVLLKGVNDTPEVMVRLMQRLLMARVRPTTSTWRTRWPVASTSGHQ